MVAAGSTAHPLMVDALVAQRINLATGFKIINPWTVPELSEEWLAVLIGIAEARERRLQKQDIERNLDFENYLAKRRAAHKSYRKR